MLIVELCWDQIPQVPGLSALKSTQVKTFTKHETLGQDDVTGSGKVPGPSLRPISSQSCLFPSRPPWPWSLHSGLGKHGREGRGEKATGATLFSSPEPSFWSSSHCPPKLPKAYPPLGTPTRREQVGVKVWVDSWKSLENA